MSFTFESESAQISLAKMDRKHIKTEQLGRMVSNGNRVCLECNVEMSCRRDNMFRHFHQRHYSELVDLVGVTLRSYKSPITTKEQYISNVVEIMVSCNLPFSFWSNPAVQRNQQCFIKEFGMTCSAKAMREILAKYST